MESNGVERTADCCERVARGEETICEGVLPIRFIRGWHSCRVCRTRQTQKRLQVGGDCSTMVHKERTPANQDST